MSEVNKYAELKNSAEKATEGPWDAVADEDSAAGAIFVMPVCDQWVPPICRITSERDAIYVAEANPSVILDLIADFDAAQSELAALREELASMKSQPEWVQIQILQNGIAERDVDLAAAEQRNAELVAAIVALPDEFKELSGCENTAGVYACIEHISEWVAVLQPT